MASGLARKQLALVALALATAGCAGGPLVAAASPGSPAAVPPAGAHGTARVVGRLAVRSVRDLQQAASGAAVLPFARQHLARVEVRLSSGDGRLPAEPTFTLAAADLDRRLEFPALEAPARYQVAVRAFQPEWADLPAPLVEAQDDARSLTTFSVEPGDTVDLDALGGIRLGLKDRAFVAQAPGAIAIHEGAFGDTAEPEGIKR